MRKSMLASVLVMAMFASTALGAMLLRIDPLSTATTAVSQIVSLSQDGLYVGGSTTDPFDGNRSAAFYNLSTSTWTTIPNSAGTAPLSGDVTGIAHVAGGSLYAGLNRNDNNNRTYGTANQFGGGYVGSTNSSSNLTPTSATMTGNANLKTYVQPAGQSTRSTADGTDAWTAGFHSQGTTDKGPEAYIWKGSTAGAGAIYTTISGRSSTKAQLCSISGTGRAVGYDGYTSARTAAYVDATSGTATLQAVGQVPGYASNQDSYAWGISEDGNYITGCQRTTTNTTRPQGFLWKVGDPSATLLPDLNGLTNQSNAQSYPVAVADDGAVVGYTWLSGVTKNAAVWFPGTTKAQLLWDVATTAGIDLTGWTTLGTGAAAIEKIGSNYYIAGNGTYNGYARGYVLVIPEPASLSILALGGLALLRRRR